MACKREARKRHNTIAFWLSDEEKAVVEARIKLAGISKGEYYRSAILGQQVQIIAGRYRSDRLAQALEEISRFVECGDVDAYKDMQIILQELLELMKR
jgi:vacuolar-type H+-ATPase catalytic subunit A/Vma1